MEIDHRVSKEASNEFWRLSNSMFHRMYLARGDRGRKIPQISHLREKLYKDYVPPVNMDVGFKSKESGEVTVLKDVTSIPVSRFPTSQYQRLYEIASVEVSSLDFFLNMSIYLYKYI